MGFKYQILCSTSPEDCVQVTLNHLESIREIVGDSSVDVLIESAIAATVDVRDPLLSIKHYIYILIISCPPLPSIPSQKYTKLSQGDLLLLQQTLFSFFQDRRVKVSIFLQDSIQNMDGSIILNMAGPVSSGSHPTGTVNYYDGKGSKTGSKKLKIANCEKCEAAL